MCHRFGLWTWWCQQHTVWFYHQTPLTNVVSKGKSGKTNFITVWKILKHCVLLVNWAWHQNMKLFVSVISFCLSVRVAAFIPLFQGVAGFLAGSQSQFLYLYPAKAGYILDESPAHRSALTDGRGRHTRCNISSRGIEPETFSSLVNQLYLLIYSRPWKLFVSL